MRFPTAEIVVTTVTETGREAVEQRLAGQARHAYAPLDFPWAVGRCIEHLRPSLFVCVETELWPNLLRGLRRRGIPAVLVNGRLSSRSFRRYRMLRGFFSSVLRHLRLLLVQSERDVQRFVALGAKPDCIIRTGNLKFDQPPPPATGITPEPAALGLAAQERLIVAGSTHPGEEEELLDCYRSLLATFPSLVFLLAPRHIERTADLEAVVKAKGFRVVRRSALPDHTATGPRVILLDTRGELAAIYRHCAVAFVGGTLAPIGGHNLLEPGMWGKPVLFGPYTDHCAELADLLVDGRAAMQVADGRELRSALAGLLEDANRINAMGTAAHQVVRENRGAVQRTLDLLGTVLQDRHDRRGNRHCAPSASPVGPVSGVRPLPSRRDV